MIISVFDEVSNRFVIGVELASQRIRALSESYPEVKDIDPTHGMSSRERALYLKQHRSTGPNAGYGFDRSGRKVN